MRTCLEIRSMDERHAEEIRNDYNRFDQYNEQHSDALATGDAQGKGTGNYLEGPDRYTPPHFSPERAPIDRSNFDTDPTHNAGNGVDNMYRGDMTRRNKYGNSYQYCPDGVFYDYKLYEGQTYPIYRPIYDADENIQHVQDNNNTNHSSYVGQRDNIGPTLI